jgi:cytochrome b561
MGEVEILPHCDGLRERKAMHWLIALQLVAVYACINLADVVPEQSDPQNAFTVWHTTWGSRCF